MGDRHRSRASMDRDRGSRESSRLRDYDRYDAYDRPYERERRSRERSPLRPDPYDDRYRDPPPIRRGDRYPDDPFDRRDPYGRRDEYYRDRREGDRYLRDERDDPYRDPYRRDSYEYRDRDRDRERDRDGFERGRPTYHDYPEPVEPVQRPIDCEVIVVNRQQREYAESVERSLKQVGLVVDITYLGTDISLAQALDDVSRRGVLYAIIVTSQHALHRSVTLNILHGTPQEHRNMPLDDALSLIARNFERYMQNLREKTAASNLALAQVELSIPQLLCLLADGKQLTLDELTRVIAYLQERHKKLLETQPGASLSTTSALAPASSAAASTTTPTSDQGKTTAGQQAELQAKILSIFNPSGSTAATTSLANTVTNTLPSGGTLSSFNVQASVTPTEPVSSATTSLPSLMAQSIAPTNSFAQHQATAVSSAISNSTGSTVSGAMSVGNRAPVGGGPPGPSDSGPATSNVGINFDNPSVQKALDNLIQSGPNLLKNLGQVGQIVQGVSGGQSLRGKTLLSTPPSGNDGGIGFDNMHGGGGVGRGAVPLQSSMGGGIMSGGRGGPMIGGVGMGGPGRGMGGGDIGMGGPGRGMGGGDIGMGGMPRGPPGMQRGGFARGRGGRY
ncbi:nuclear receptor coactivator 5-like isoform X2 [Ptychodera flava]